MPLMELGIHEVHWLISLQQLRHQPFPLVRLTFTNIYEHHILPISVRISAVNRTNDLKPAKCQFQNVHGYFFCTQVSSENLRICIEDEEYFS